MHLRLRAVLEHIETNLDGDLRVVRLAEVAGWSPHHLQRSFAAATGIGLREHVARTRLRQAALRLAFREDQAVHEIAADHGFAVPATFSRAFRRTFGQSPSEFRRSPDWLAWSRAAPAQAPARGGGALSSVRVVRRAATPVVALEYRGDVASLNGAVETLVEFRRREGLGRSVAATYDVLHGAPSMGSVRVDLCVATNRPIPPGARGLVSTAIPAGRYAVLRHEGPEAALGSTIDC